MAKGHKEQNYHNYLLVTFVSWYFFSFLVQHFRSNFLHTKLIKITEPRKEEQRLSQTSWKLIK